MKDNPEQHNNIVHFVDPDVRVGKALSMLLKIYGIGVRTYADAEMFLTAYATGKTLHGCLFIESELPGLSGLSLLRELRDRGFSLPSIVLTSVSTPVFREQALHLGAIEVLEKPLMNTFLLERLAQLLPDSVSLGTLPLSALELHDGTRVRFRVIRPEDADIEQAFVRGLSKKSNYLRFFSPIKELSPEVLERFTNPRYPGSYALIATICKGDEERQIGVARYEPTESGGVAEFAIVVADEWQGQGLATYLLGALTAAAAVAGIKSLEGLVLNENEPMRKLAHASGFSVTRCKEDAAFFRMAKTIGLPAGPG